MNVAAVRDRVQRMLTRLMGQVQVDEEGTFSFRYETTHVFVNVAPFMDGSVVNVWALTNVQVPASPELFRYVATSAGDWVFGHLGASETDDGVIVSFRHTLLADYLDPQELRIAVVAVAHSADELDDLIKERFGGRVIYE